MSGNALSDLVCSLKPLLVAVKTWGNTHIDVDAWRQPASRPIKE